MNYKVHQLKGGKWSYPICKRVKGKYIDKKGKEISKKNIHNIEEYD